MLNGDDIMIANTEGIGAWLIIDQFQLFNLSLRLAQTLT